MNFIKAIQHATIGYGIRRKIWGERENCWLYYNHDSEALCWCEGNCGGKSNLCPEKPDLAIDILPEDIRATDWETV